MSGIDIKRFINNFAGQRMQAQVNIAKPSVSPSPATASQPPSTPQGTFQPALQNAPQNLQMNTLQSIDRAIYARDVMGVPKNLNEFIYMTQRGMTLGQFNSMFASQMASQRSSLSQLQAQILAQLQGMDFSNAQELINKQMTTQLQSSLKNLNIMSNGMINLTNIANMIQVNGKEALTKIIMSMTEASKMGINDLSQMKDMARLINASISVAAENEPTKTLKLLLMLYLPWLPLNDGVDFDLDIETKQGAKDESDSILTVTITTINFGTIIATLYLETSNSVQIMIECGETFPRAELQQRLDGDKKHYSMDTLTNFQIKKELKPQQDGKAKANINMSQTTEINPYLLLSAHSIIKHVIDMDNNFSIGITSHVDLN